MQIFKYVATILFEIFDKIIFFIKGDNSANMHTRVTILTQMHLLIKTASLCKVSGLSVTFAKS